MKFVKCMVIALFLISQTCQGSLPLRSEEELRNASDLIVVGYVSSNEYSSFGMLDVLYEAKGSGRAIYKICSDNRQEGLKVSGSGMGLGIFFLKKNDDCYYGAVGYWSYLEIADDTKCVFAGMLVMEYARQGVDVVPVKQFLIKLFPEKLGGVPEYLNSSGCIGTVK